MNWIEKLNLTLKEKEKLNNILSKTKILSVKLAQNNLYLFLQDSKVIIIKNSTENLFIELIAVIEKELSPNNHEKKIKRRRACEWRDEEIAYLKRNFEKDKIAGLVEKLKKSQYQILLKAEEIKLLEPRGWSINEVKYLENNINVSNYELAIFFKRTINSIKAKKRILKNLKEINKNKGV